MVERATHNRLALGSNPSGPTLLLSVSEILQFKCTQCGKDYWEEWHYAIDYSTKLPNSINCQDCRKLIMADKARRVKIKILRYSLNPMELLQAEVTVLRSLLKNIIPEHDYWEKVYEAVKQSRRSTDETPTVTGKSESND